MSRMTGILIAVAACIGAMSCGSTDAAEAVEDESQIGSRQDDLGGVRTATLYDAAGTRVGTVSFWRTGAVTSVTASVRLAGGGAGTRGFHVHANDNPANGEGCIADPAAPPTTHFTSADGHYNPTRATHGHHAGDMPALIFTESGYAALAFITDHFVPRELVGRAVIVHERADNYGNVPVGAAPTEYTPNSEEATTLTRNTGNAGSRVACGIIR